MKQPVPAELEAAVEHVETLERTISVLRDEVRQLHSARISTLLRMAGDVARIAERDGWDSVRLLEAYEALNRPLFFTAWQSVGLPHHAALRADAARARQREEAPDTARTTHP